MNILHKEALINYNIILLWNLIYVKGRATDPHWVLLFCAFFEQTNNITFKSKKISNIALKHRTALKSKKRTNAKTNTSTSSTLC